MRYIYLLFPILILLSCSSADEQEQTEMINKVMAVHDAVMPEMGKISKFKKQAQTQSEVLFSDSLKANDEQAMELENLAIELDAANESMMVWMRNFSKDFEGMEHEEIIQYLEEKKAEIDEVKKGMEAVLDKADSRLKN